MPDRRPTDVGAMTADVASMFRSAVEHTGLGFTVDIPSEPVSGLVDRAMWSTIVTNLLSNSAKYTQRGGIDVRIAATEHDFALTVSDTGVGIPPEDHHRVFDRFYRGGDNLPGDGSGIGLAVVHDLVNAHGGTVQLVSEPARAPR